MKRNILLSILVLALGGGAAWLILGQDKDSDHPDPDHGSSAHDGAPTADSRGANGGRLFAEDGFVVELAIFERGVPPEFRAWITQDGRIVPANEVEVDVRLTRPGGAVDVHTLAPEGEFLRGSDEVYEPHSFDYVVEARHRGRSYRWELSAPEMQTTIPAQSAERSGVDVEAAGEAVIPETLRVYGEVKRNGDRIARAVPRFAGLVREARKSLGESVAQGEVVAVVESNETLVPFDVAAPIGGVVVERSVSPGETVAEGATLYLIADLSEVWVDLAVPRSERARVRAGQRVFIHGNDGAGEPAEAVIATLLPLGAKESQSLIARVVLPNPDGLWRPGWFVRGDIEIAEHRVPVAVREAALQSVFDFIVVFSRHGDLYQARPLELGKRGAGMVEVLKGLSAGEDYVTANSFLIKADILKGGATHDH